jgi:nucleoside-diphosphate-sugar epimerase
MTARGAVPVIVVGGAGFVGSAVARRAVEVGRPVTTLDRVSPSSGFRLPAAVVQHEVDLLTDALALPDGHLVLAVGTGDTRAPDPWRLVLEHAVTTARLLPSLVGRDVVLVSSVEVHGPAGAGLPLSDSAILRWTDELLSLAGRPCPPWAVAAVCRTWQPRTPRVDGSTDLRSARRSSWSERWSTRTG